MSAFVLTDPSCILLKILYVLKDHSVVDFCVHSPPGGLSVKIVNNGVVSRSSSRSLVYNAIDNGLATAECTLWEWAWLTKNCTRLKCRLEERADPIFGLILPV